MKAHIFIETYIPSSKRAKGEKTNEYWFIKQYVEHIFPSVTLESSDITCVDGYTNLDKYDNKMKENTKAGILNLVIIDCDDSSKNDGGYKQRSLYLESLKQKGGLEFEYFLFPNNQDEGAFENLLLNIINPEHKGLLDCFDGYEKCISGKDPNGEVYKVPNIKAKIYSYISSFKMTQKEQKLMKAGDWDFHNSKYWNLDSPYLIPLKEFLQSHLSNI